MLPYPPRASEVWKCTSPCWRSWRTASSRTSHGQSSLRPIARGLFQSKSPVTNCGDGSETRLTFGTESREKSTDAASGTWMDAYALGILEKLDDPKLAVLSALAPVRADTPPCPESLQR